jgi:TATA-box binding protein (TBP) (component of TFIID and TFIIIB)
MISVGTKSEEAAADELRRLERFLVREGYVKPVRLEVIIQNIVVVANFESYINLEELAMKSNIIYEPEQFPAGILRIEEPVKASILVFSSGKTIIAGLKSSSQITLVVQRLAKIIGEYGS